MKVNSQISHVIPMRVEPVQVTFMNHDVPDFFQYRVVTALGNPVGDRLLKGSQSPYIKSWGPFQTWEEAEELRDLLTAYIKKSEKRKRTGRRTR